MSADAHVGSGTTMMFHARCEPPLGSGRHSLTVTHTLASVEAKDAAKRFDRRYSASLDIDVDAPRFGLTPDDIYSVYPPKGSSGAYADTLPHVVFSRRTLPWEAHVGDDDTCPWLGLLVLGASDFDDGRLPDLKTLSIEQALVGTDDVLAPQLPREAYEKPDDLCSVIEIDRDLFRKCAPTLEDLRLLAHVRAVETSAKETASFLSEGQFAVVVANRLPEPAAGDEKSVTNRAYLVSFLGQEHLLPKTNDEQEPLLPKADETKPATTVRVRLVVLADWSFGCGPAFEFKHALKTIDVGRLACPPVAEGSGDDAQTFTNDALRSSYVPLRHRTRLGEETVSWFRGPLVSPDIPVGGKYDFCPAADGAVRYSPEWGMMDVSYAAAYQIGRLIALQDRQFTNAMRAFRQDIRRQVTARREARRQSQALDVAGSGAVTPIMAFLGAWSPDNAARDWSEKYPEPVASEAADLDGRPFTSALDLTLPGTLRRWLARLSLLYRVPFSYLVPAGDALPAGSLRFFNLDPGWIVRLLEGACSVGRTARRDQQIDRELRRYFLTYALEEARRVRARLQPPDPDLDAAIPPETSDYDSRHAVATAGDADPHWPLTGFLMRSPLVAGWQGLEMRAREGSGRELVPLRLDRLAPDVMLCIFDGNVASVELRQPPEGLHFGASLATVAGKETHVKTTLRSTTKDRDGRCGHQLALKDGKELTIPMRGDRVLAIAETAQVLKDALAETDPDESRAALNSAEFALQMVEAPGVATFRMDGGRPA